jgi:V8-like Glu-specific endopeptidase
LLSLDRKLNRCTIHHLDGPLWITGAVAGIMPGMSGSPILAEDGTAIGVVATGDGAEGGPNPHLAYHLPGWFLKGARLTPARALNGPL